ncbi:MAG: hypothetical protein ACERKR_01030, partial [Deltaproteobacteria bacterium]
EFCIVICVDFRLTSSAPLLCASAASTHCSKGAKKHIIYPVSFSIEQEQEESLYKVLPFC